MRLVNTCVSWSASPGTFGRSCGRFRTSSRRASSASDTLRVPELSVDVATISYSSGSDGIKVHSPVAETTLSVDAEGFLLDYPGLAERI